MPATRGRPHPTELLLCGHHYRASRQALAAADADIFSLDGARLSAGAWPEDAAAEDPALGAGTGAAADSPRHGW